MHTPFPIKSSKKFGISRFFDFSQINLFRIKLKNIVCSNLTTKTSKYRLDVSSLFVECFTYFFWAYLRKYCRTFFSKLFQFFFEIFRKIIFSSLHWNLGKTQVQFFEMQIGVLKKKLVLFWNLTSEEKDYWVNNYEKLPKMVILLLLTQKSLFVKKLV